MRTETFQYFHGNGLSELEFEGADAYKRILFLPGKCYFNIRTREQFWAKAYEKVLAEQGVVFIQVHQPEDWEHCVTKLQQELAATACMHCTPRLHHESGNLPYVYLGSPTAKTDLVLSDNHEVFTKLSDEAMLLLTNTQYSLHELLQRVSESISQNHTEPLVEAMRELLKVSCAPDYLQYTFLLPGVIMVLDNNRYLHATLA